MLLLELFFLHFVGLAQLYVILLKILHVKYFIVHCDVSFITFVKLYFEI